MSIRLLQKATATLLNFVEDQKTASLLKKIGLLFDSQTPIRNAAALIEKSRFLIKKWKVGTKEERELATEIERVVNDYNRLIKKENKRLRPVTFKYHTSEQFYKPIASEELRLMRKVSVTNLPKHLLPKYQIAANAFEPLPGEVIVFTDTSHFIKSQQTGYPDPALVPYTIPEYFLPQNYHLLQKKAEIAEGLLPKGKYNAQAKKLYALQKELVVEKAEEYREVGMAFEHLFNNTELGTPLPQDPVLTTPAARDLFNHFLTQDRTRLAKVATFQQLIFYKWLCMKKLDLETLRKEMRSYLTVLSHL